ncbi:conserved hypothetical protein [Neospora caninum Liverpool]|uniref:60 kDa inner membrane protein n=1 Tax=Neospora caninum (strain Liverpool) TaxID=572307 RepID=F0VN78_NEOCL|nr:conserved hypothetical protein [Neospora caninum Liverpool]CBZ55174.1 conserved hypothetical protein [Neospora caninum Liverpool]|eukprot:XP_003885202.1 conserved hypothetical protein [Neospora caninum Liverpool]
MHRLAGLLPQWGTTAELSSPSLFILSFLGLASPATAIPLRSPPHSEPSEPSLPLAVSSRKATLRLLSNGDCFPALSFPPSQATSAAVASSYFPFKRLSPPCSPSAFVEASAAAPPAVFSSLVSPSAASRWASSSRLSPSFSPLSLSSRSFFSLRSAFAERTRPRAEQEADQYEGPASPEFEASKVHRATYQHQTESLGSASVSGNASPASESPAASAGIRDARGALDPPSSLASPSPASSSPASSPSSPSSPARAPVEATAAAQKGDTHAEEWDPASLFVEPTDFAGPSDGSYAAVLYERIKDHTDSWLSNGAAVNCAADLLLLAKDSLDLPWAVALPIIGCALRFLTLPFAIAAERDIRLRGLHGAEFMELNKMLKEKQRVGLGSPEFLKEREKVKKFIEAHNLSVFPMSSVQMLFIGITISLFSYALRNMAVRVEEFPAFIAEHPGWFETLALPDPTLATTFLTIFGGLSILIAGWMVSDKLKKFSPVKSTGPLSPAAARLLPSVIIIAYATFMGTAFPGGLVLLLLPAAFLQIILARLFRLRSVTRALNFVPDSAKPLHAVHADILRQRVPELVKEWEKSAAEKNLSPRKMGKGIVALWKEKCLDPKFQTLLKKSMQQRESRGREGGATRPLTLLRPSTGLRRDHF